MEEIAELPTCFGNGNQVKILQTDKILRKEHDEHALKKIFNLTHGLPMLSLEASPTPSLRPEGKFKIGVVFCGRQAPGGHNVICGIYRHLPMNSTLIGFKGGTAGLFSGNFITITHEHIRKFRNTGGFHLLGRTNDSIKTEFEKRKAEETCRKLRLDGLVCVGGTYTAADTARVAEHFAKVGLGTSVVCVPATIDNDVCNEFVECSLGFSSASRVYSSLIGNYCADVSTGKKYWAFIRVMGRGSGHLALSCALSTAINRVILAEEVDAKKLCLRDIVDGICELIIARSRAGKDYGAVLIPEGLIQSILEVQGLLAEMESGELTPWSHALLDYLPPFIRQQLALPREKSGGGIMLSRISTEVLIAELVKRELHRRKFQGSFKPLTIFMGYQARASMPDNFDMAYGEALGATAAAIIMGGHSGYMATVNNLSKPVGQWTCGGVPAASMLEVMHATMEVRYRPSLVNVNGTAFAALVQCSQRWGLEDCYVNPGPLQFRSEERNILLRLSRTSYMARLAKLRSSLDSIQRACQPGCKDEIVELANAHLRVLANAIDMVERLYSRK